ncbi:protein lifeguard 4-like [Xenia sp. Carnegie-2017]|uniref:protein lifeguard 4-like n=1 Tax=Xenia sp. Carnegie-2017 TaxID=2897299 RepID=UPI001F04EE7B|nr:protein lifeguard 4-like [Xenia sp. Carnegie-2017]
MAATKQSESSESPTNFRQNSSKQSVFEDDFMYGVTVAQSSIDYRLGFLRKVYGILTLQLALTIVVAATFMSVEPVKMFVQGSPFLLIVSVFMSFGLLIALAVKRRESPINMYLLVAFTFAESYSIGTVVTLYDVQIVIQAFLLTITTTLALTLYTFQSKRDFSSWGAALSSTLWILILAGILQIFMQNDITELAIAIAGAVVFSLFIVYDTHLLMHKLSPEEYILASINLYLDILNLFMEILKILNALNRKN